MTRFALYRFCGALALFAHVTGCADLGPEPDALAREVAEHRQTWEAGRPDAYVVELERQCFCGTEARGPVVVTVEGAGVTSRVYAESGGAVPEAFAELFPSVDGLFDILEDALVRGAERVDVTWQTESGAPASFYIDYRFDIADEEVGYVVLAGPA